jgi:hypothetical protein
MNLSWTPWIGTSARLYATQPTLIRKASDSCECISTIRKLARVSYMTHTRMRYRSLMPEAYRVLYLLLEKPLRFASSLSPDRQVSNRWTLARALWSMMALL